jgi:feruloyl esterase
MGWGSPAFAATCESLLAAKIPNVTITSAQSVPAGAYQPPGSPETYADLPAFCRVVATARPVPDSSIGIEVWLPAAGWNGRYQQVGNHGFAGVIHWEEMAPQLKRGFTVAATDDGHVAPPGAPYASRWAVDHPAKIDDLAWRAVHQAAVNAKLLIAAYYAQPPRYSYFNACSTGGRQGMREAQQFPADFDGILAGGAATYWTGGATEQLVMSLKLQKAGFQGARGAAILAMAQEAATRACDIADGVKDGVIANPTRCRWNPRELVCKAGSDPATCITPAQSEALAANFEDVRDPVTRQWVMGGMSRGSEFNQVKNQYYDRVAPFGAANYKLATRDADWDGSTFDMRADLPKLVRVMGVMNSHNPDLRAFQARGGKMIQYHGWDDAAFTPEGTVKYYDQVIATTGRGDPAAVRKFYQLYMMPGIGHCGGGPGPYNIGQETQIAVSNDREHDAVTALMDWVEHGVAPEKLIATKFSNDDPKQGIQLQRPLFPYPAEAVWNGAGDTNGAASFHKGVARR